MTDHPEATPADVRRLLADGPLTLAELHGRRPGYLYARALGDMERRGLVQRRRKHYHLTGADR